MKKGFFILFLAFTAVSCTTGQSSKDISYAQRTIPAGSSIGIIVNGPNAMKNAVLMRFMQKGYNVKAVNANDVYELSNYFNISDFKYLAYKEKLPVVGADEESPVTSAQKSFDSIFKLNIYNYETNKADALKAMRDKWDVRYMLIFEMADWESSSWGRAIDLSNLDLIWIHNHGTSFSDTPETIADIFIKSISGR